MSITLSVTTTKSADDAAPLLVHFDATATTSTSVSDSFRDIEYFWDFGDSAGTIWSYGQHTDRNASKGPLAAHCYLSAGTYTVKVTAYDGTTTTAATTVATITVTDPSVANGWTITCVNPVGDADFSAAPTGAAHQNNNSFSSAISSYAQTAKSRVLFKGGATFTADPVGSTNIATSGTAAGGIIGAYGTGKANLTVNSAPATGSNYMLFLIGSSDWRIVDLSVTNPNHYRTGLCALGSTSVNNSLLLNIESTQCSQVWHYSASVGASLHGIVNCSFRDCVHWDSGGTKYVMYISNLDKQVILGSLFQGPQADYGTSNYLNHNTRFQVHFHSVIANSKWVWGVSPAGNPNNYIGNCFWHGGASPNPATKIHVYDTVFDQGQAGLGPSTNSENTGSNESIDHFIADSCYGIWGSSHPSMQWWGSSTTGGASDITIRNCVAYSPGTGIDELFYFPTSSGAAPSPDKVTVVNNTCYLPNITSVAGGSTALITLTMATTGQAANNLFYTPALLFGANTVVSTTNATAQNNVTTTQARSSDPQFVNGTGTFGNITDFQLQSSSYAISLGTSAAIVGDLNDANNTAWSSPRSLGSFQYVSGTTTCRAGHGKSLQNGF